MAKRRTERLLAAAPARYLSRLSPPRSAALAALELSAAESGDAIAGPEVGRLLEAIAAIDPKSRVLELGTGSGYGTIHLVRGAREGRVVSVDRDPTRLASARAALATGKLGERVELVLGEVPEILEKLPGEFDLVVVDVDPGVARRTLDRLLPRLPVGGRLLFLGLLRGLFDPANRGVAAIGSGGSVAALEQLHPYLLIHPQLATVLLPIGDGVALAVKRRETIRELGGPF